VAIQWCTDSIRRATLKEGGCKDPGDGAHGPSPVAHRTGPVPLQIDRFKYLFGRKGQWLWGLLGL
jgi:hypothetical protein